MPPAYPPEKIRNDLRRHRVPTAIGVTPFSIAGRIAFDPASLFFYNYFWRRRPTTFSGEKNNLAAARKILAITTAGVYQNTLNLQGHDEALFYGLPGGEHLPDWVKYEEQKIPPKESLAWPTFASRRIHKVTPLNFGVTLMGTSNLFDTAPGAKNTSLILWSNQRGLWIDPLLNWQDELAAKQLSPACIEAFYLTHVHPDHVYGLLEIMFEKITTQQPITIYLHSQVASLLLELFFLYFRDQNTAVLSKYVKFHFIDEGARFGQAQLLPFQSLHSMPTFGFLATQEKKSIGFTADHCHNEHIFARLEEYLVQTRRRPHAEAHRRLDYLRHFLATADLLIHDAGEEHRTSSLTYHSIHTYLTDIPRRPGQQIIITHLPALTPAYCQKNPHFNDVLRQTGFQQAQEGESFEPA